MDNSKIFEEIKKKTLKTAFEITVDTERKPGLTDSKYGGMPYWEKDEPYPVSEDGKKLYMLAQINFEQLPENDIFPKTGILQFFIAGGDVCGADFDNCDSQTGHRVVFHKNIDKDVTAEDVKALDIPTMLEVSENDFMPFEGEFAIDLEKTEISMGIGDYRYNGEFSKAAGKAVDLYNELSDDELESQDINTGQWLLGYPFFTQEDPRAYNEELRKYDTMLFQMDSVYADGVEIMWGDMGVANFFIESEALARHDFSKIMYTWDCC